MEGYAEHTYGDRVAEIYDRLYADAFDVVGTVETLVRPSRCRSTAST